MEDLALLEQTGGLEMQKLYLHKGPGVCQLSSYLIPLSRSEEVDAGEGPTSAKAQQGLLLD